MTGSSFSAARARMRRMIRCDCTGAPPGELITRATALARLTPKALSMAAAAFTRLSPARSGDTAPITPASLRTGTTGAGSRQRAGSMLLSRAHSAGHPPSPVIPATLHVHSAVDGPAMVALASLPIIHRDERNLNRSIKTGSDVDMVIFYEERAIRGANATGCSGKEVGMLRTFMLSIMLALGLAGAGLSSAEAAVAQPGVAAGVARAAPGEAIASKVYYRYHGGGYYHRPYP